jgi:hypothetical protein
MSKPMKAKKTMAAPARMPPTPNQRGAESAAALGRLGRRQERRVVRRLDVEDPDRDHEQHDRQLDHDDDRGDPRRELDPQDQHPGHHQGDEDRRDVDRGRLAGDRRRQRDPEVAQQLVEVARPADRHGRRAEGEFEDEVPADDPGHELAEGGVGERVGRAGDRHGGGELRVAERGQPADDAGDDEGDGRRRARGGLRDHTGQHEDAGADDDADAEHREIERGQMALELVLRVVGVLDRVLDGLDPAGACGHGVLLDGRFPGPVIDFVQRGTESPGPHAYAAGARPYRVRTPGGGP